MPGQSKSLFSNRCIDSGVKNMVIAGIIIVGIGASIAIYQIYFTTP